MDLITTIEKVLSERVRPALQAHGGDLVWEEIRPEEKRIKIRLIGACSGCPGTQETLEYLVESSIREVWPEFEGVDLDTGVSREMLHQVYQILGNKNRKS